MRGTRNASLIRAHFFLHFIKMEFLLGIDGSKREFEIFAKNRRER